METATAILDRLFQSTIGDGAAAEQARRELLRMGDPARRRALELASAPEIRLHRAGLTYLAALVGQALVYVPPGPFLMGSDPAVDRAANRYELPQHSVTLPGYWIGRYPVTNAAFALFIQAGGYSSSENWSAQGWQLKERAMRTGAREQAWTQPERWDDPRYNRPTQPVAGVNWYEADAYCRWLSRHSGVAVALPSEAEWEKAARGSDGRIYPWGNQPPNADLCTFDQDWETGHPSPVGQHSPPGDSPYGCADMAGSIVECTRSIYRSYPYDPSDGREQMVAFSARVIRGGGFRLGASAMRCAARMSENPDQRERDGHALRSRMTGLRIALYSAPVGA